jgi:hypothetical protein
MADLAKFPIELTANIGAASAAPNQHEIELSKAISLKRIADAAQKIAACATGDGFSEPSFNVWRQNR